MNISARTDYLWKQISGHAALFFTEEANLCLRQLPIRFVRYDKLKTLPLKGILIPVDPPVSVRPRNLYKVPFGETEITVCNPTPPPQFGEWRALPNEEKPLWYISKSGSLLPAWDIFGTLMGLLTFREEQENDVRDSRKRFLSEYSPRLQQGLLEVPTFNEAVAVIVAAAVGLVHADAPRWDLSGHVRPPVVVLSHDCDILLGNDFWTQSVRAFRVLAPLVRIKLPRLDNIWWILRNAVYPRRFYYENCLGMIELERSFGFNSTFYLLNGLFGRYGARSGSEILRELVTDIPQGWDIGIHYNYDTFLENERFKSQLEELRDIVPGNIRCGRAHYLRFHSVESLPFLESFGIRCDESAGYPDRIGYRCGIGGCFQAFDSRTEKAMNIWEVPLVVMDAVLVQQYGKEAVNAFERLLKHLTQIGGAISIVFHPGQFFNPEHRHMLGIYHKLLIICRENRARSMTALALCESAKRNLK